MFSDYKPGFPSGAGEGMTDRGNGVFDISFADWKTQCSDLTAAQIVGS